MGATTSSPIRPEISLCGPSGLSGASSKIKLSCGILLNSRYFMRCVTSGICVATALGDAKLPPMPADGILNQRFNDVLASIDLPADKERILKSYSDEQKWDIICALERLTPRDKPSHYLSALNLLVDSNSVRFQKKCSTNMNSSILSHLEVSLRTNTMEWVEEFLGETNQGLEVLVKYLKMSVEMLLDAHSKDAAHREGEGISKSTRKISRDTSGPSSFLSMQSNPRGVDVAASSSKAQASLSLARIFNSSLREKRLCHFHHLNSGKSTTDVHICLLCLRAIMKTQIGFNLVVQHREAINVMVLSLAHKYERTRALILNLLADICIVKGSHEIVVAAFDNFKQVCREHRRFQTLLQEFMKCKNFHIEYMVSCLKFLNAFVHTVEDLNYRVHLQYEMTALGLDDFLNKLSHTQSEELKAEIDAYRTNFVDVSAHMKTTELNAAAIERIRELEKSLAREMENNMILQGESESLGALSQQEEVLAKRAAPLSDLAFKIPQYVKALPIEYGTNEDGLPPLDIMNLNGTKIRRDKPNPPPRTPRKNASIFSSAGTPTSAHSMLSQTSDVPLQPAAAVVPIPSPGLNIQTPSPAISELMQPPFGTTQIPPNAGTTPKPRPMAPPTLPKSYSIPIAPPMPSAHNTLVPPKPTASLALTAGAPDGAIAIKRQVQTQFKLPTLNWKALRPNQVRGTIFSGLDDERVYQEIDFMEFEERFKIGSLVPNDASKLKADSFDQHSLKHIPKEGTVSLLETKRQRNVAISRCRLMKNDVELIVAINDLDLEKLPLDQVELLIRMVPTEDEVRAYNDYILQRRDVAQLSNEDKFMLQLSKVERISTKLTIMNHMGNFNDLLQLLNPQILAVTAAATSLKHSAKLKDIIGILLAFGNYMNSSKHGPVYGFKLDSLNAFLDTKSSDKRMCLLHFIVATVRQKYPHLLDFGVALKDIDKAAHVCLENVASDVEEADKGMNLIRDEIKVRTQINSQCQTLRQFLSTSEGKLLQMKSDLKTAQDAFKDCVEYFAESTHTTDTAAFFTLVARFVRSFNACDRENELRRRQEQATALGEAKKGSMESLRPPKLSLRPSFLNELKLKTDSIAKRTKGLNSEPVLRAHASNLAYGRIRSHDELETSEEK